MLGIISERRIVASIHYLQRNLINNPLEDDIGQIAVSYLDALSDIIVCKETSIEKPAPALIDYYIKMGFTKIVTKAEVVVRLKRND